MPHVILYVRFTKMRSGPCHIVSEDSDLLQFMSAYKAKGVFDDANDLKVKGSVSFTLNQLEARGYHVVGFTSLVTDSNPLCKLMWTLSNQSPSKQF